MVQIRATSVSNRLLRVMTSVTAVVLLHTALLSSCEPELAAPMAARTALGAR